MDNTFAPEPTTQTARQSSPPNPYTITIALIAINVLVFLAMVASGVSFMQPTPQDVFTWGGDFAPATVGAHQWWRLLTSMFLHFGIIHIAFNMYVLYQIGPFIEVNFGRIRYLVIYFLAGWCRAFSKFFPKFFEGSYNILLCRPLTNTCSSKAMEIDAGFGVGRQ